ncbi:MAG: hypothetical protein M1833_000693 [Piccolia ochrophora]|nr:MAG: hypothetical protein M1833_000693 [Piccolia ochrophora]
MVIVNKLALPVLLALSQYVHARPQFGSCESEGYTVDSEEEYTDGPKLVTGVRSPGCPEGCAIQHSDTYGISTTIEVGADIDIGEVVGVSASASVAVTESTETTITVSQGCPKNAVCGLTATETRLRIKGKKTEWNALGGCKESEDYEITVPKKVEDAEEGHEAIVEFAACYFEAPKRRGQYDYPDCPPVD